MRMIQKFILNNNKEMTKNKTTNIGIGLAIYKTEQYSIVYESELVFIVHYRGPRQEDLRTLQVLSIFKLLGSS